MASYRYIYMQMNENFDGSNSVSDASVRNNFLVSQTLWQDLDGPQLGEDFGVNAGVRFSF